MFGKKQIKNEEKIELDVLTIPKEFYAGANPVVKFKEVEEVIDLPKKKELTQSEKQALDKANAVGSNDIKHPANILSSRKFVFLSGAILFLLLIGGASAYYFLFQKSSSNENNPPPVSLTKTEDPVTSTAKTETPTSTEIINTSTEQIVKNLPIDFPSTLMGFSSDYDNDNVSDLSEGFFNTDPTDPDTDQDKYPDGHELYYLYNPSGFEPMRLIDSGLVKEYKNPIYKYKLYIPNDWVEGEADSEYKEVLFSTINGEYIMVRVYDFISGQTFSDWFFENAPEEKINQLSDFSTAFNLSGKKRNDGLVYYFMDEKNIYVITYHPTEEKVVNYKIVLDVLARSFRLGLSDEQTLDPEEAPGYVMPDETTSSEDQSLEEDVNSEMSTNEEQPVSSTNEVENTTVEDQIDPEDSLVI